MAKKILKNKAAKSEDQPQKAKQLTQQPVEEPQVEALQTNRPNPAKTKKIKKTVQNTTKPIVDTTNNQNPESDQKKVVSKPKQNKSTNGKTQPVNGQPADQVYISGIPYEATEDELKAVFGECGKILSIKLPRYQDSGRCRGYSHIKFSTIAEADKALTKNGVTMGSRYLKVERAAGEKPIPQNTQAPPIGCKTLFVKGLSYESTEDDVRRMFMKCGKIDAVRMVFDAHHKYFKGFCYIDFKDPTSLKAGLKMNGTQVEGRKIITQFVTTPARKGYKPYKKGEAPQKS